MDTEVIQADKGRDKEKVVEIEETSVNNIFLFCFVFRMRMEETVVDCPFLSGDIEVWENVQSSARGKRNLVCQERVQVSVKAICSQAWMHTAVS